MSPASNTLVPADAVRPQFPSSPSKRGLFGSNSCSFVPYQMASNRKKNSCWAVKKSDQVVPQGLDHDVLHAQSRIYPRPGIIELDKAGLARVMSKGTCNFQIGSVLCLILCHVVFLTAGQGSVEVEPCIRHCSLAGRPQVGLVRIDLPLLVARGSLMVMACLWSAAAEATSDTAHYGAERLTLLVSAPARMKVSSSVWLRER